MTRSRAGRQRGAALMTTMIILTGMLVAAGTSVYLLTAETRSIAYTASARRALFCAEAGLATARSVVAGNYATWSDALDSNPANDPYWYPITGSLDGVAGAPPDFEVTLRDNDDELPPLDNNAAQDNDLKVFIVSRCVKYPEYPRAVTELVEYSSGGNVYRNQAGQGAGNTGNAN